MAPKPGTHMGGIRTVKDLRDRCRVDDETGCWHWRQAFTGGRPLVALRHPDTQAHIKVRGTRAAAMFRTGKLRAIPEGRICWMRCMQDTCVNPEHSRDGSTKEYGDWRRQCGTFRGNPKQIAANRKTNRAARGVLTMDLARAIRSSDEPAEVLSARLGVKPKQIRAVRAGTYWRECLPGASVFNLAPALPPARAAT